jgi:tetratricopeptide (TPR) repeat protein
VKELLEQAESLEREKKFDEAAEVWKQLADAGEQQLAASGCPPLVEVQMRQAGAHYQAGQASTAIGILEPLRLQAENAELLRLLARAYLDTERFQDAVEAAGRALALDPDSVQIRSILGRAHMGLGRQAGSDGGAQHWQDAIEQFTDILVMINQRDQLAKDLKRECVRKRDDFIGETMRSQFRQFTQSVEREDYKKAFTVLNGLVHLVVEHAMDTQYTMPDKTVRITQDFIAMVTDYSRKSRDLASQMGSVFAQLHSLAMWAHLVKGDSGAAQLALEQAVKIAPQDTLPWMSKAELMFTLRRQDEIEPALAKAESFVRDEHDRFLMGATYHMLGDYDRALGWVEKVNKEKFKAEAYRPDRAERVLQRLEEEIKEEKELGVERTPESLQSEDGADWLKRMLGGGAKAAD